LKQPLPKSMDTSLKSKGSRHSDHYPLLVRGNTILNSVNTPGSVSTPMLPPCCFTTMSWAIDRPRPVPSPEGFGGEEWVEYFVLDPFRDAGAVIANTDFDLVSEVLRHSRNPWLEAVTSFRFAFGCGIESVRYQIEQDSGELLRINVSHAGGGIKIAFQSDTEAGLFCSGAVMSEIQAVFDY
jgi:hypothetical protein